MAEVYGNTVHSDWKTYIVYTIKSTQTQVSVTISAMGIYNYSSGWIKTGDRKATLSATGQTTQTSSTHSDIKINAKSKESYLTNKTFTWARTSADQTKTITGKIVWSNGDSAGTSTKSISVSVPALSSKLAIEFDANADDVVGEMPIEYVFSNTATPLQANAYTRTTHNFIGWNTSADGSGTSYADGAEITTSANVTLYAQWHIKYVLPMVSELTAYRVESNTGSTIPPVKSDGTMGYVSFSLLGGKNVNISSANAVATIGGINYTMSNNSGHFYCFTPPNAVSISNQYDIAIEIRIPDTESEVHIVTDATFISKEQVVMSVNADGSMVSFFQHATDDNVEEMIKIAGKIFLNGNEQGVEYEYNSTTGWRSMKFACGVRVIFGTTSTTTAANTSDGGGYRTAAVSKTIPSGWFNATPMVFCSIYATTLIIVPARIANPSTTSTGSWCGYRVSSNTNTQTKTFQFICIGTWK